MTTRQTLILSIYILACTAATMLGFAEGGWLLPSLLTVPIAITSYAVVEQRGFRLPTIAVNSLGIFAIFVALVELAIRDIEGRLLFGAHLLVYLTWILLWQEKGAQQRWGLLALSVLQVAVGAVLTTNGLYGAGLGGFLVLIIWTLIHMQLLEAEERKDAIPTLASTPETKQVNLLAPGRVLPVGRASVGRWPVRQIVTAVVITTVGAASVGAAFFLLVPRFEFARSSFSDSDTPLSRQRITGFTNRVRLGAFGEILESNEPVFEVRLYGPGDTSIAVEDYAASLGLDEPLFRGLTLSNYENGEWAADQGGIPALMSDRSPGGDVRQEYQLRSIGTGVLFSIAPVVAGSLAGTDEPIRQSVENQTIFRPPGREFRGNVTYEVFSPRTAESAKAANRALARSASRTAWYRGTYTHVPGNLTQLPVIAAEAARPDGGDATPSEITARLLTLLRDSGEYRYTLSGELIDPGMDPIEDFLINRKAGHCEYFASALALMLRAEGIPSRVVSGFKGGEKNRLSNTYEVQQRHAHAWVEAYIDNEWTTLDPSPASGRSSSVAANAPKLPLWNDVVSATSEFWRTYIVQLNIARQRRTLAPLREFAITTFVALREQWWPVLKEQAYSFATDPSRWISWQGGVVTFFGLLLAVGLWRVGRRLRKRFRRLRDERAAQRRRGRRVEFYERFRRLCRGQGWTPKETQTQREFAAEVASRLRERAFPRPLVDLPAELAEDFYLVRFGERDLDETRQSDWDLRLKELESAFSQVPGKGHPQPEQQLAMTGKEAAGVTSH